MFSNIYYWARAGRVFLTAAPILISILRDYHRYLLWGSPRLLSLPDHQHRAVTIRNKLEDLGVVFIKVGQVISSRGDLLPPIYVKELSRLQDQVRPLPEKLVRETLENAYGCEISAVFEQFSFIPLATASIGQVHRARYHGQEVVVKFARPAIGKTLARDSRTAALVLTLLERIFILIRINDLIVIVKLYRQAITEIFRGMLEEADLGHERRNAELMARSVAHIGDVVIPKTINEICTEHVLVLEYWSGIKISHIEELKRHGFEFLPLMNRLVTLYVRMIILNGVYHADPHPGNIYVLPDGRLLLFDFGIVRTLSEQTRNTLMRLAIAALKKNTAAVIDELYNLGILQPTADRKVALEVANKVTSLHFQQLSSKDRVEEVAEAIRGAFQGFPLDLPQELVYVFRCLSLLEGLGTRYQPGWNLIADGYSGIRSALLEYLVKTEGGWWNLVKGFFKNILTFFQD